jgi:hypothetical protein
MKDWEVPIIAIGLGAQSKSLQDDVVVNDGTLNWLRVISSKSDSSSNIWTRGPYSATQLNRLGIKNVTVGNCPSHFINDCVDLGKRIDRAWKAAPLPRGISVAGGNQSWKKIRNIEHQLVSLIDDPLYKGQYVVQSSIDMLKIAREDFESISPDKIESIRSHINPHYTLDEFKIWCRNFARVYLDVVAWMDSLRQYDLTIGPRYHGTALAMQAERMALCIAIDSRTEELCIQTGVPFVKAEEISHTPITRNKIKSLINFDPDNYDKLRYERAAAYVNFLESNGLQPADFLKRIASFHK